MNTYPHYRVLVDGTFSITVSTPMEAIVYARSHSCEKSTIVSKVFGKNTLAVTVFVHRNIDNPDWQKYKERYNKEAKDDKFYFPLDVWDSINYR